MMKYSYKQLLILFLCLTLFIDDTYALRLRIPSLRMSATFRRKTDHNKKKNFVINNEMNIPDNKIPLNVGSTGDNDEL